MAFSPAQIRFLHAMSNDKSTSASPSQRAAKALAAAKKTTAVKSVTKGTKKTPENAKMLVNRAQSTGKLGKIAKKS